MSTPAIDLDPREVLEHLRALGYDHITKDQLKQFIKDLKKLIKYDLRKIQSAEDNSKENRPRSHESKQTGECGGIEVAQRKVLCQRNRSESVESRSKSIAVQTQPSEPLSSVSSAPLPSNPPPLQHSSSVSNVSSPSCSTCASAPRSNSAPNLKNKPSSKKENATVKPVSSFIRVAPSEVRFGRNDPVTLYHYYQSLWSKQNRPGENPHADIRWRIRHKMMAPISIKTNLEKRRDNPPWVD